MAQRLAEKGYQLQSMLLTYCKMAWRNLLKDRQYTLLNLVGLGTGLACALLIWMWVNDELQVDKYNANDARLYQVLQHLKRDDGIQTTENTAGLLAGALQAEFPEVERATTVLPASWFGAAGVVQSGPTTFKAGGQFITSNYLHMFTCPVLQGDINAIFADRRQVAISDELAAKLFPKGDAIGKTIVWKQNEFNGNYMVSAIFAKNPANAVERFDLLLDFALFVDKRPGMLKWVNSDPRTYVLLRPGTDVKAFDRKLENFMSSKDAGSTSLLSSRPFSDKYLYNDYSNGKLQGGRITYVRLFTIIAVFILLIACVNFMNLSTAKAARRIREVGIQKTLGASRASLAWQHLSESLLMTLAAMALGLVLVAFLLPAFNQLTGKQLSLQFNQELVLIMAVVTVVTGILAGCYPALYISGFRPAAVLKGDIQSSVAELWTRKGLVVFQFTLSLFGIAAVLVIQQQIDYIRHRNLGYNRENLVHFEIPLEVDSAKMQSTVSFLAELKNIPGIVNVSSFYHDLTGGHGEIGGLSWPGKNPQNNIDFVNLEVGANFMETMKIRIVEGRNVRQGSTRYDDASPEIIFNQSAIRAMGIKDPIGKTIKFWDQERTIVGVAEDFHFESLYHQVRPCFFQVYPVMPNVIVRLRAGAEQQTIPLIKQVFGRFFGSMPFDYAYLDEDLQRMYQSENKVAVISKYLSGLAILISCLGLFGLAAFTAKRRQKEIGIRKVLGGSVPSVVLLLSKGYLQLMAIAALIALPLASWVMQQWLNGFAYHAKLGIGVPLLTLAIITVLTLLTISFQSIRAAMLNPVKSLKGNE